VFGKSDAISYGTTPSGQSALSLDSAIESTTSPDVSSASTSVNSSAGPSTIFPLDHRHSIDDLGRFRLRAEPRNIDLDFAFLFYVAIGLEPFSYHGFSLWVSLGWSLDSTFDDEAVVLDIALFRLTCATLNGPVLPIASVPC
jgi:hypothetical protein